MFGVRVLISMRVPCYEFCVQFAVLAGAGSLAYALAVAPVGVRVDAEVRHFIPPLTEVVALVANLRLGLFLFHTLKCSCQCPPPLSSPCP